jgi:hypothetical protein
VVADNLVVFLQHCEVKGRVRHIPIWKSSAVAQSIVGRQPPVLATSKMRLPEGEGVIGCFLSEKDVTCTFYTGGSSERRVSHVSSMRMERGAGQGGGGATACAVGR